MSRKEELLTTPRVKDEMAARLARAEERWVLEPDLSTYAIAERFGFDLKTAQKLRARLRAEGRLPPAPDRRTLRAYPFFAYLD